MKISIIADCHLNKSVYKGVMDKVQTDLPFRTVDFMNAFEHIINQNINSIKPDLMVIAGDIYDTYDPSNSVRTFFNNQLSRCEKAKIPVIMLVGNHDICKKYHALSPLKALGLSSLNVVEEPTLISFKEKVLMLFPYSLKVEKGEISIKDQFHDFLQECRDKFEKDPSYKDKEKLFFGHFGVKGAILKSYGDTSESKIDDGEVKDKKQRINKGSEDIGLLDLECVKSDYIFLGDFHQHQILNVKNSIAMYTGSIERTDITEYDQEKGFILLDDEHPIDENMGKAKFITYDKCRPMLEFKGTSPKILKQILNLNGEGKKGAIVKVSFEGNEKELRDFSSSFDDIHRQIVNKIDPVHVYHDQNVIDEGKRQEAKAIEDELIEKGQVDEDLVMKAIEEMIMEKEDDSLEQQELMTLAREIYKETLT